MVQILLNFRSLYTGVLFYFLMGRQLTRQQWSALALLVVGGCICQYANEIESSPLKVSHFGIILCLVYGAISVTAGVYSELLLKKGTKSIFVENAQLYAYGIFFNFVAVAIDKFHYGKSTFRGWELASTWLVCFNISLTGSICSVVPCVLTVPEYTHVC